MAALSANILPLMALTACAPDAEPILIAPEIDEAILSCAEYPEITDLLKRLPAHIFLAGSNGQAVLTDGRFAWVRFDVVNDREAMLIRFSEIDGRRVHFECWDDLGKVRDKLNGLPTARDLR